MLYFKHKHENKLQTLVLHGSSQSSLGSSFQRSRRALRRQRRLSCSGQGRGRQAGWEPQQRQQGHQRRRASRSCAAPEPFLFNTQKRGRAGEVGQSIDTKDLKWSPQVSLDEESRETPAVKTRNLRAQQHSQCHPVLQKMTNADAERCLRSNDPPLKQTAILTRPAPGQRSPGSVASMTVPVYIAEVAPPHLRGRLVTINTLFITGGQFFASVVDGIFSYLAKDGWRYMLGLSAVPAVIQFLGFLFLPESPRWLIQKGQTQRARRILSQMRGNQAIDEEYDSIKNNIEEEEKEVGAAGPVICRMLTYPPTRRALIVGCGLQMFQQLSGINTVMYYSATILQMSGVEDDRLAIWLAALTAFINFVFTLVGVWLVERMGRRKLTLGSLTGTAVALIILASGFLLSAQVSPRITLNPTDPSHQNSTCTKYSYCNGCMLDPDCGLCYKLNKSSVVESSCIPVDKHSTMKAAWGRCSNESIFKKEDLFWAYNFCPTPYSWTALLGLILYLVFFAPGMGPMPWTVNSEIYPLWARSTGNACSSGVNWVFNVLVSLTFLHTAEYLTYYGAFFLYAGFAALGLVFIYGCLPETKGKKLEEIESLFENRLCTCGMSDSDEGRYIEYIRVKGSNYHLSDNDASDVE
ncbi:proton myo-inositol cotransporter [Geospiza fortis]|uniref:Proton myo-inositol cotransporter n=1 Tax=Geospiza fortis TaxID=48883 RepID=A0A8N5EPM3_GEOFO|nr:proton myo-inositol cotransporter [Geospiza fortis]